ncbi:MAG: flagellar hook-basal body protein [Lachnospiraceae bacterium]|nr:flagellar hook-basal body protein [Lachnospiraceae bacterium]
MVKGLYTAYTGMVEEQRRLDVTTNNLANSNTVGYKKEGAVNAAFADTMALRIKDSSVAMFPRRIGIVNLGDKIGETYTDYSQGSFHVTDKPSDLAIAGDGFFAIEFLDKQGNSTVKYTRDGEFTVDNLGYIVTSDGDHLLNQGAAMAGNTGQGGWVRIDPLQEYSVDQQGFVYQGGAVVAQIGVVDVENTDFLEKYGENMYNLLPGGTVVDSEAEVEQGALETSNVNIVDEMVTMITIQRAYEAGQKMIQTEDSTIEMAVSQVGRI